MPENDQQTALGHTLSRVDWQNRGVLAKSQVAQISTGLVTQQSES